MLKLVMNSCVSFILIMLAACGMTNEHNKMDHSYNQDHEATEVSEVAVDSLSVELKNTKGEKVGIAALTEEKNGVRIKLQAEGLAPGRHGFHIHEIGKCEQPDFKTAGEHYNPFSREHGFKNPKGPHAGDLPNIEVDANGKASVETFASLVTLQQGKPNSLLDVDGSAVIIHEQADDYKTNPAGNSGDRIACGVVAK
ncbi:superoxide dismutase family protein [Priestia megaterium]|nr:superoxide dismutase family protein [Priestia megaterium]